MKRYSEGAMYATVWVLLRMEWDKQTASGTDCDTRYMYSQLHTTLNEPPSSSSRHVSCAIRDVPSDFSVSAHVSIRCNVAA